MASKWSVTLLALIVLLSATYAADNSSVDNDWRVFINSTCIITDEPFLLPQSDDEAAARVAPLFGILVSKLASTLIGTVIEGTVVGLGGQAARKDTKYVTAKDFNLYLADLSESPATTINPRLGCITVVAGQFQPDSLDCTGDYIPREVSVESLQLPQSEWQTARTDNSVENILRRANVCMAGQTKSMYEARIQFSDDKTAYRMNNAGYWINSLMSTKSTTASRNLLYTLEMVGPSAGSGGSVLSTAWVNIGRVSAGDTATGSDRADWLRVPPMSRSARQAHASDTAVHDEVIGQIDALERAVLRDARLLAGIQERAGTANPKVRKGLEKEMTKIGVRVVTKEAMLDARRAEYNDLPQSTLLYMPVTMRFGITETRSERKAMQMLADIVEANSDRLADTASDMIGIDRSLNLETAEADLEILRENYFDALVAVNTSLPDSNNEVEELQRELTMAKESYNAARLARSLSPID
ncbi:MAG: hypothetical protein V3S54_07485 [Woeseiaceae bacterium]